MSETNAGSAPSESAGADTASVGSTQSTPESSSSAPSKGASSAPAGGTASQATVEAMENATRSPDGTFEVVIDGESMTLTLEELKAGYQKAKSSAKRYQEASEERKRAAEEKREAEEFRQKLLKNPLHALLEAGVDTKAIRNHYETAVWEMLQQDRMTPEQKDEAKAKQEFETEKQRIAREKAEIEAWKKERDMEREAAEVRKHEESYARQIGDALTKHGLPQTPEIVSKMASYMAQALEHGYDLSVEEAAAMYKEETDQGLKSLLKKYSPDQLMALLGEDGMKALRSKDVEVNVKNPIPTRKPPASTQTPTDKKISAKDFFKSLK